MEQVLQAIRIAIDTGAMRPGVKYSVYQVADQLGISRTPVRDALLRLEGAGLIRFEARQGFYILLPDPREIADIFAVRIALEVPAAGRAAALCTPDAAEDLDTELRSMRGAIPRNDARTFAEHDFRLHDRILESAGNRRARQIVAGLRESTRLLGASTADRTRSLTDIDDEHRPIIAAIRSNDPDAAEDAMYRHLVSTGRLLVAQAARDQQLDDLDVDVAWDNVIGHRPHNR